METIRFSPIGKEDCSFGTGTFEVTLADGRIVMLSQIDIGAILNAGMATTTLTGLTLTTPIINGGTIASPTLSGTIIGTYTLAGTPTITGGVVSAIPTTDLGIANKSYVDAKNSITIMENGRLTVTMAANAVTIALKGNDGNDPSATNPVVVSFRSSTATSGAYVTRTITSALSTVISSGSTGGTVSGTAARIYVGLLDNAGTPELYWWNPLSSTSLYAPPEPELITTTAEGGAGAADSAQVLYSSTARASVAHRIVGYFEATEATAGTWATAASKIQLMGPGVRRTGEIVQRQRNTTGAVATGTTVIPLDDTIPQITEGNEYMTQAITPFSTINLLAVTHLGVYASSSANQLLVLALFQDATASALASIVAARNAAAGGYSAITLLHVMQAGTVSATTLRIRAGSPGAGTTTFNGDTSARTMGGIMASSLMIEEVFV